MASEDVIELGSSDDEVEPQPKKRKPRPNAMVHIPTNLHGITITAAPSNVSTVPKAGSQKAITFTKLPPSVSVSPIMKIRKINGRAVQKSSVKRKMVVQKPIQIQDLTAGNANPTNLFKKLNSQQVVVNKVNTETKFLKNPIRINNEQTISNLPPGITVTRAPGAVGLVGPVQLGSRIPMKHGTTQIKHVANKKPKLSKSKNITEVLTVELDDDDTSASSTANPQWYLRPEEETKEAVALEEENNKEPEPKTFIEITIEDSPLKPKLVQGCQVQDLQSINIDDSPVKLVNDKNDAATASDEEDTRPSKVHHSKKKLEYPREIEIKETIEIEINPLSEKAGTVDENIPQNDASNLNDKNEFIVEIEESPIKPPDVELPCTPKKDHFKLSLKPSFKLFKEKPLNETCVSDEFHPVYQSFIDLCFKLENSEDMKKIVEKKVKTYYRQVPKEYTESEEFIDMVSGKILAMKAGPEKMYLYIKDIVDELNLQRKMAKAHEQATTSANKEIDLEREKETENFLYGANSEFDSKRKRQIRKLEKTLKKLHRAIQKLEEQEVDFDDEEDSVYLLTERYKERMVRVHAKFCQLTNTKMPSEPRVQIDPRPGQPPGPAKRLEKWVNKKVPIGTPLPFPDFHDVLRCVRDANDEDRLGWNEADIMAEARDLFTRCGSKLQRRRQENEWRLAISRISLDIDPAENNGDLKQQLENNRQLATKKVAELVNKYAEKQNQLKLEGVEIGDKEAEESPVESEEEEIVNEGSLENKDKRKERLRRLLQEKSKKIDEEKENRAKETIVSTPADVGVTAAKVTDSEPVVKEASQTEEPQETDNIVDSKISTPIDEVKEDTSKDTQREEKVSDDDENKLESDVDELHLLQKLHSGNEINSSTPDSSDSEFTIAISDTLESDDDKKEDDDDVISIENSSYSESEMNKDTDEIETIQTSDDSDKVTREIIDIDTEIECTTNGIKRNIQTNNDEYNESIEDILLASTDDDEMDVNKDINLESVNACVNLKDDNLSIGETVVEGEDEISKQKANTVSIKDNEILQNDITTLDENSSDSKDVKIMDTEDNYDTLEDSCLSCDGAVVVNKDDNEEDHAKNIESDKNVVDECVSLDDEHLSNDEVAGDNLENRCRMEQDNFESNENDVEEYVTLDDDLSSNDQTADENSESVKKESDEFSKSSVEEICTENNINNEQECKKETLNGVSVTEQTESARQNPVELSPEGKCTENQKVSETIEKINYAGSDLSIHDTLNSEPVTELNKDTADSVPYSDHKMSLDDCL